MSTGSDAFAGATPIPSGSYVSDPQDNTTLTLEAGEPIGSTDTSSSDYYGDAGDRSAWWSYTPASAGTVGLDTIQSTGDTILVVYTGTTLSDLVLVALNDDDPNLAGNQSDLTFEAAAGTNYFIQVLSYGQGANATDATYVLHLEGPEPTAPAPPPPPGRWELRDDAAGEAYVFPINPDSMTSPLPERSYTFARAAGAQSARTVMAAPTAVQWQFGGAIRTQDQHDALEAWSQRPGKLVVTDHLGRKFEVMITAFEATERTPTRRTPWRLRYTVKADILRQL